MADFGPEHLNVTIDLAFNLIAGDGVDPFAFDTSMADRNAFVLQQQLNYLLSEGRAGGFLYFPPGRYFIGRNRASVRTDSEEFGDIVVPPNVTLWFAPGAMLVPMRYENVLGGDLRGNEGLSLSERASVRIEIHGDIIAERRQIFASFLGFISASRVDDVRSSRAGLILLAGDRIREVYPEWWGAAASADSASLQGPINAVAIQNAIDAAWMRRVTPRRVDIDRVARDLQTHRVQWNRRSAIPIVMMGEYYVDREIIVRGIMPADTISGESEQVMTHPFLIEGERGVGGTGSGVPTLLATETFRGAAMLTVRGPVGFTLRNLTLDGNFCAPCCLSVIALRAVNHAMVVENCAFYQALSTAVVLDAESTRGEALASMRDFWNIAFTHCQFTTGFWKTVWMKIRDRIIPDAEFNLVCVEVRLGDNEGLEFRNCISRGPASCSIHAFSGRFAVNQCMVHHTRPFHLTENYLHRRDGNPDERYLHPSWEQLDAAFGTDIVVEAPDEARAAQFPGAVIPAAFTLNQVRSHSWQLLATRDLRTGGALGGKSSAFILLNVKSQEEVEAVDPMDPDPPPAPVGAGEIDPPAVYWGAPGQIGCPLVMIGCEFQGKPQRDLPGRTLSDAQRATYMGVVRVASNPIGPIYNIANTLSSAGSGDGSRMFVQPVNPAVELGGIIRELVLRTVRP